MPNNLGETWRRICSVEIPSISALEVSSMRALQIDIYLHLRTFSAKLLDFKLWLDVFCFERKLIFRYAEQ